MAENTGVLVVSELSNGHLASVTAELLGASRQLAGKLNEKVSVVLLGSGISQLADEAASLGADKVYVADNEVLKDYQADAYLVVLASLIKEVAPRYVLFGQTPQGRDLAPRLAFRTNSVLTTDCIELDVDPQTKALLQTKPVFGGNAIAIFTSSTFPQMASVRQKTMTAMAADPARKPETVSVPVNVDPSAVKAKLLGKVKEQTVGIRLEDAKVVVCGGRGIGGPEGFKQLEEVAKLLKGAVGASRPPCDSGWLAAQSQVGLTGKIVTPDLYIAIGVSGASQHMAGCSGAKIIVAINKDAEANIFKEARFGIVADWKQALPAFTAKVKELLAA